MYVHGMCRYGTRAIEKSARIGGERDAITCVSVSADLFNSENHSVPSISLVPSFAYGACKRRLSSDILCYDADRTNEPLLGRLLGFLFARIGVFAS